ncbi:MAG: DUF2062 domain-containing protein [Desulfobacterales bacterium]|nr:DUF2062 domain-containing protein [Desulfobacterales bacterium]
MVKRVRKLYERFIQIRGNPKEIALGFALGLFIGFSPTMGLQIALAVFFASIFKWNKYAAAIAVWITNPLTAPFIYSFTYVIGAKLIGTGNSLNLAGNFDWNMLLQLIEKSPAIFISLFVGGVVVGLPIALFGYYLSFNAVERYQKNLKEKLRLQKEKLKLKVLKKKLVEQTKPPVSHKKKHLLSKLHPPVTPYVKTINLSNEINSDRAANR